MAHGYVDDKQALLARLRRAEGQVRGIARMVDEDAYCIDILTQISALTSALQAVAVGLLDDHLKHCVFDAARMEGDQAEQKIKEASDEVTVTKLNDEQIEAFRKRAPQVEETFIEMTGESGKELLEQFKEDLKAVQ